MAFYWLNSQLPWQSEQRGQHSVKYAYFVSFFFSLINLIFTHVKCLASEPNSSQGKYCDTSSCVYTQFYTEEGKCFGVFFSPLSLNFSGDCLKPFPHLGITRTQTKRWWCARGVLLSLVVVLSSVLSKLFCFFFSLLLSIPQQMLLF